MKFDSEVSLEGLGGCDFLNGRNFKAEVWQGLQDMDCDVEQSADRMLSPPVLTPSQLAIISTSCPNDMHSQWSEVSLS
jgi:hypothetical protein